MFGEAIKRYFAPAGFFSFGWVIPGMAAVAAVGLMYWRFVLKLPAETRRLFLVSAGVFVGGGLGVEMLGAKLLSVLGEQTFTYTLLVTLEEAAEMIGVLIFLYGLLRYVEAEYGAVRIVLGHTGAAGGPTASIASRAQRRPAGRLGAGS